MVSIDTQRIHLVGLESGSVALDYFRRNPSRRFASYTYITPLEGINNLQIPMDSTPIYVIDAQDNQFFGNTINYTRQLTGLGFSVDTLFTDEGETFMMLRERAKISAWLMNHWAF